MIDPVFLEVSVVVLGIFLLMAEAFGLAKQKSSLAWWAIGGLVAVFIGTFLLAPNSPDFQASGFYVVDGLSLFFKRFLILSTILVLVMSVDYLPIVQRLVPGEKPGAGSGEFFILPVFTCAGLMWMASATDFIMIFCALELVTISFYIQVAYMRRSMSSLEAGTKYLILGALSTGFLVYGITWIFGTTGQTNLAAIRIALSEVPIANHTGILFGLALILVSLGFKIAAAPFQFWAPDVYQGAPTPVTAYLAVASKAAGFLVLIRVLEPFFSVPTFQNKLFLALVLLAALTLIFGNLAAIPQTNFKRLLGYSSIAHAGYLLVGLAAIGDAFAGRAVVFYLAGYLLMTFLAFLILVPVTKAAGGDDISNFNGLARRAPGLALAMLIGAASLAGVPFTVGFFGKFFIFETAMNQGLYLLVLIGVVTVASGFYYYFKVIRAMYWQPAPEDAAPVVVSKASSLAIYTLAGLIILLGVYPKLLIGILP
ncbi:MAG: NADH-quinone oxidoreductase subunit N [Spartobacteria bacterium]